MLKNLRHSLLVHEPALWLAWLTVLAFLALGNTWLSNLQHTNASRYFSIFISDYFMEFI